MVSAEQREYAEACEPPKMTETDSTDTDQQGEGLLEQILSKRQSEPRLQTGKEKQRGGWNRRNAGG